MKYRYLGSTGIKVSEICFGTMSFGSTADEKDCTEMFHTCINAGINFFDCADVYQRGKAEEILGKLIAGNRHNLIITSKAGYPMGSNENDYGASRKYLTRALEDSLKRLKTDYIDIYFLHRFDEQTPLEETLRALEDMTRQGKILYPGASNFAAWQVAKALGISSSKGWADFKCTQPMYNLVKRQAEVELFPLALSEGLGVITYSPLASGLLTGKYNLTNKPDSGRLIENKMYKTRYESEDNYKIAEKFVSFAKSKDYNPSALAVAWAGSHPAVTAPIIGARNPQQLKDLLQYLPIEISKELRSDISSISPEPPPATDRSEERYIEYSFSSRLREKH